MNAIVLPPGAVAALIAVWLLTFVAGQLLLKPAMDAHRPRPRRRRIALFSGAIACMTVSFFLGVGLLERLDVSWLFPFQGLSVLLVALFASWFLRERLSARLVVGALLMSAGIILVSTSEEKPSGSAAPPDGVVTPRQLVATE